MIKLILAQVIAFGGQFALATVPSLSEVEALLTLQGFGTSLPSTPSGAGSFRYHNPYSGPDRCGTPLTADEKVAQQRGLAFPNVDIGSRPGNGELRIFGVRLLRAYERGVVYSAVRHPDFVLNFRTLMRLRDEAWALERQTFQVSTFTGADDESDAFRHFVFAGLLKFHLGAAFAERALAAHEYYQVEMSSIMDRFNNKAAIEYFTAHESEYRALSDEEKIQRLVVDGITLIQLGHLVVLKPARVETPAPSVSFYQFAHRLLANSLN